MAHEERGPADPLRPALAALATLVPEDREAIVRIGVAVESARPSLAAGQPELGELLEFCLKGLQALYLETAAHPRGLGRAIVAAAAAAELALASHERLREWSGTLERLLAQEATTFALVRSSRTLGDVREQLESASATIETIPGYSDPDCPGVPAAALDPAQERAERDAMVTEFLIESSESLDQLDLDLVALERDPVSGGTLAAVFRALHTIKGNAGFLSFTQLEALAHAGEELLGRLRDGRLDRTPEFTDALLAIVDAVRETLSHIETHGREGDEEYGSLIQTVAVLQQDEPPRRRSAGERPEGAPPPERFGDLLVRTGRIDVAALTAALRAQKQGDPRHIGEILVEQGVLQPWEVKETLRLQEENRARLATERSIRVEVDLLDRMTDLGEALALTSRQLLDLIAGSADPAVREAGQRLEGLTDDLRACLTQSHLQPIGTIWQRYARVVRDLAVACGKQVRVEMVGSETGVEKTLLEAIKDPLTHVIRNAVDHGIEAPEQRRACGKPGEGYIVLRAFREGELLTVEVSDDGAGVDPERIRQRAVERGLLSAGGAASLRRDDLLQLIFLPGFSTAEAITHLSGRGVGLDVVKTNIERVGGTIEIDSHTGGTTFRIRLPNRTHVGPSVNPTGA
jgi:two-component system chemotaxis sensor kinase CheA